MTAPALARLALGDLRERVRRPSYLVTLAAAVGLAYLAVPATSSRWTVLDVGGYRGEYTSAYVGTAVALAGALWLSLGGFFVVRTTVGHDERTGVGRLLRVTDLPTRTYLLAKFTSNVLVLTSMAGIVTGTGLIMQLARGESRMVDPVAFLLPLVTLTLPVLVVTAAVALLFETTPLLRSALGNVVWVFVAPVAAIVGQSAAAPFGGFGTHLAASSFRTSLEAQGIEASEDGFSLGLTYQDVPLETFVWDGLTVDGRFLLLRLAMVLTAVGVAWLPTLWFARFDPDRGVAQPSRVSTIGRMPDPVVSARAHVPQTSVAPAPRPQTWRQPPASDEAGRGGFVGLVLGEFRALARSVSRWWWAVAIAMIAGSVALPAALVPSALLAMWVWPVMVWSRLGSQKIECDLEHLLQAFPAARRRLLAEWAAGLVMTVVLGAGVLTRLALASDTAGVVAWVGGALFVTSLAMFLGRAGRTSRLFQVLYLLLWYLVVNGVSGVDFLGASRTIGEGVTTPWLPTVTLGVVLLLATFGVEEARARWQGRWPAWLGSHGKAKGG